MKLGNGQVLQIVKQSPTLVRGNAQAAILNSCERPFRSLSIDSNGNCYVCICEAWLPISVGNIKEFSSLADIWTSPIAKTLQTSIENKDYQYCAVERCGVMERSITMPTYHIAVNMDNSCNLVCPSCRTEMINYTEGDVFNDRLKLVNHFLKLLENFNEPANVVLIGSGDPLSSLIMRPIVLNWVPKSNQTITLFTNGLLMKKLLPGSTVFGHISEFQISVDAGSSEVYEVVRSPGKFKNLKENLDWLADNKPQHSKVTLNYTVSANNALDIENFVSMCEHYGFAGIITSLENWNTFDDFSSQAVLEYPTHPLHQSALSQLRNATKSSNIMIPLNIKKLL
jgi:MoaA/NifB/PqqE/SkfB family radical SAM enzyme